MRSACEFLTPFDAGSDERWPRLLAESTTTTSPRCSGKRLPGEYHARNWLAPFRTTRIWEVASFVSPPARCTSSTNVGYREGSS